MLALILAHRHMGRLIGQDVGRHQVRIDVEPDRGVLAILARLFLELGHAVQPAKASHAVEDPGELGVGRHLALVEDDMLAGIDAGRQERRRHLAGLGAQLGRVLPHRDRMQVHDAEDAVMVALQAHPVADGAQVIAQMQIAGRLNAGEDAPHEDQIPVLPPAA